MRPFAPTASLIVALALTAGCSGGGGSGGGGGGSTNPGATLGPQPIAATVDRGTVAPGDTVTLTVAVPAGSPAADLYGAAFDVTYDPAVLELAAFDASGSMIAGAESGSALQNGDAGRVVCFVSKQGAAPGESGAGTIAELRFTAKAAGATALGVEAIHLSDAAGAEYAPVLMATPRVRVP